jgi:myo-inositol-1(or 4)-monophosphatase
MVDRQELLELAVATAEEAGRMLVDERPVGGPDVVQTKSSPTDVVTQMDRAAERLIVERLLAARPGDGLLGEEGASNEGTSGVRWVIDPIDGTVNYLYDLPDWAVSVAAQVDGESVAGAVVIPRRGEVYSAVRGEGARLRTPDGKVRDLRVNTGVPLARALVATGFGYEVGRRSHQGRVLGEVITRVRDIRRSGSCCVDLCSLAAGRVDVYYERGVQAWDVAAGSLIAVEAGARVAGLNGDPMSPELVIAASPELFAAFHDVLAPLDPVRDDPA